MIVQIDSGEAHRVCVPDDVSECDTAGPSLECVHPVAEPRIVDEVLLSSIPDIETISGVEEDRDPDSEEFESEHEGKTAEEAYLMRVCRWPIDSGRVRNQDMFHQERAYR